MFELLGTVCSRFLSDLVEYLNQKQRNIYKNKNSKKKKFECSNCWGLQVAASSRLRLFPQTHTATLANGRIFYKFKIIG